jgi:hypothetical protein
MQPKSTSLKKSEPGGLDSGVSQTEQLAAKSASTAGQSLNPERLGLSTLEDISHLILQSHGLAETLQNIVALVSNRMQSEVCSIYLCEEIYR